MGMVLCHPTTETDSHVYSFTSDSMGKQVIFRYLRCACDAIMFDHSPGARSLGIS